MISSDFSGRKPDPVSFIVPPEVLVRLLTAALIARQNAHLADLADHIHELALRDDARALAEAECDALRAIVGMAREVPE
ncbi:hypothetical protein [Frigoriglobus tundricola]|uniref:Uncharacterized protein n=1 Tax=Frigoriglobus tundricola TaxID=2774151 RepID=A0A6M5Z7B9_9BACT|nr:hypothetical protein [Frigoriglobus tundricola]QJX01251.1 hypothetical protein FTUN_8890 [Frigoriglobus tundricola]